MAHRGRKIVMIDRKKDALWTRNFILLGSANFLMFTAFYFLIPILPVYIENVLGGSKSTVGLLLAAYTLAALMIRPLTGVVIDGKGRRRIYIFTMVIFALFFNAYLLATSVMLLLIIRLLHGFAWGITTTSGNTLVVDIIPPTRRGEGISIYGLTFTVAMAIGPLIGITLLHGTHYNLVFISSFLMALSGWILTLFVKYPVYKPVNGGKLDLTGLMEKSAIPVSMTILIMNITYGGVISFIALYAKELGVTNPGMFFLFYAGGVFISRAGSGRVFDNYGPTLLVASGALLLSVGFFLISTWKTIPGFFTSAFLLGFGGGVIYPTLQAMVNNLIEPHRRGAANSTLFTALDIGIGTGMILIGFLAETIGLSMAFMISSGIVLSGGIYFFTYVLPHYKKNKIPLIIPQD
ncbi:MAG: MFS transporter [Bacteroidales bacterium]